MDVRCHEVGKGPVDLLETEVLRSLKTVTVPEGTWLSQGKIEYVDDIEEEKHTKKLGRVIHGLAAKGGGRRHLKYIEP